MPYPWGRAPADGEGQVDQAQANPGDAAPARDDPRIEAPSVEEGNTSNHY
jgi:hypothetical protein